MLSRASGRSRPSLFMVFLVLTSLCTPTLVTTAASAQLFPSQRQPLPSLPSTSTSVVIPYGTTIPVEYNDAEKIIVAPNETVPVTLTVAANIRDRQRSLLIPYGSQIVGQIEPAGQGARFVAEELILSNNQRFTLEANSRIVTRKETIDEGTDTGKILTRAAIGAAAAAAISVVTGGSVGATEVLTGAGLGALSGLLLGGNNSTEVISIQPDQDLDLTLQSSLTLR